MKKKYTQINSKVIDKWVKDGWRWSIPINHEAYVKAKNGEWSVLLTQLNQFQKNGLVI